MNQAISTGRILSLLAKAVAVSVVAITSAGTLADEAADASNAQNRMNPSEFTASQPHSQRHSAHGAIQPHTSGFDRIATFPVCRQIEPNCDTNTETAPEIVAATHDGKILIYTDSQAKQIGFVDLTHPERPQADGVLPVDGEPTSVAIKNGLALIAVNTSENYTDVSGHILVVDIRNKKALRHLPLDGQPDSIAVSPDQKYVAVAIENERDEDLDDGFPPQAPAGKFIVVDASGDPQHWTMKTVELQGLAELYPEDPEPEYVDINKRNVAVLSLQENNHLVLVDLESSRIIHHFSAGYAEVDQVDTLENEPALIELSSHLDPVPREPDGVAWIDNDHFATADEGDLSGGSRGFTIFNVNGSIVYESGNALEHLAVRYGHYPDQRSENKGNEPENVEVGEFGRQRYLFVNSERSSLVFVYDVTNPVWPVFIQALPASKGPEGALAIPSRGLVAVASEEDDRGDGIRGSLNIYRHTRFSSAYPTLVSQNRSDGTPIPWGALSGLAADRYRPHTLYSIHDKAYQRNRIYVIDATRRPARIEREIQITDKKGILAGFADVPDTTALINADSTVNLDLEGISTARDGGFWLVAEGGSNGGAADRSVSPNLLTKTDMYGHIVQVIGLPHPLNEYQSMPGVSGVTESKGLVYVTFQRPWENESNPRIGVFCPTSQTWRFFYYPISQPSSAHNGWVGLSGITALGHGQFMVIESDNQAGPDASIKKLYKFDVDTHSFGRTVRKHQVIDLMPLLQSTGGLAPKKVQGLTKTKHGQIFIITDNNAVDDDSGETLLLNVGRVGKGHAVPAHGGSFKPGSSR